MHKLEGRLARLELAILPSTDPLVVIIRQLARDGELYGYRVEGIEMLRQPGETDTQLEERAAASVPIDGRTGGCIVLKELRHEAPGRVAG